MGYQLAAVVSGLVYSFGGTCIILYVMDFIPGLSLRATPEAERVGMDDVETGEFAVSSSSLPSVLDSEAALLTLFFSSMIMLRLSAMLLTVSMEARTFLPPS